MKNQEQKEYEAPQTEWIEVLMEDGICAGSRQDVVVDDENTTVSIEEQQNGGDFTIDTWN